MIRIVLGFCLFWSVVHQSQQLKGMVVDHINCTQSTTLCLNSICQMTSAKTNPQEYNLTFGCTLAKSVPILMIRIRTAVKTGKNYVVSPMANLEFNVCQMSSLPALMNFVPDVSKQLKRIFHRCPYNDKIIVSQLIFDGSKTMIIFKNKEIRQEIIFSRGKYQQIFSLTMFGRTGD